MPKTTEFPGVAVITGAGSGIGQATAKALLEAGCSMIALLDINTEGLEASKSMLTKTAVHSSTTPSIKAYQCDVSVAESVNTAYAQVRADFGRIDYSVHCAGIIIFAAATDDLPVELLDRQMAVNFRGVFLCSQAALKIMKNQPLDCEAYPDASIPEYRAQRGSIVSIASTLGNISMPKSPAYCAAKAAVISLTRSNGLDYAADRIRVNAVAPGLLDTPMTNHDPETKAYLAETFVDKRVPMKRFGQAEEIADVILFLSGNKSSFVTGVAWPIDGGLTSG